MWAAKVKLKARTSSDSKPHRPTAAGRLSDVAPGAWRIERRWCVIFVSLGVPIKGVIIRRCSEVHYTRLERKVKPQVAEVCLPILPKRHRPTSAGTLSVVKICGLWQRGKIGKIWQLCGLGKMGRIWQMCGCHWLAMAVIIRRGVTDNRSPGEPRMAVIIRRCMALARCGGSYYQTLNDR